MSVREGYKQTEIGVIPEEWEVTSVRGLTKLTSGKFNPKKNLLDTKSMEYKYPVYGGNGLTGYFNNFLIETPSIVIGRVGEYCGSVHLVNEPVWITDNAIYLKEVSDKVNLNFLFEVFTSIGIENLAERTGQPKITQEPIYSLKIPLPPLPEQQKIAAILTSVNNKIEVIDAQIAKTEQLKKGLMQKLLSEGIGHMRAVKSDDNCLSSVGSEPEAMCHGTADGFKESEIGKIPEGWEVTTIGKTCDITAGGTPSTKVSSYWEPQEVPWLSSGEVNKKIIVNTDKKISLEGLNNSAAKLIPKHSILIALAGQGRTRGTVAITEIELTTNQSVASIMPKNSVDAYFLYHNLNSRYEELRGMSTGVGGRGGLNLSILKSVKLALPPISEQKQIATILSIADNKLDTLREKRFRYEKLKKGLMQKLLTGEIRVVI